MLERFDPAARQAVTDAFTEARRAGQGEVRSEHLLVGLLTEPGPAADALAAAGLDQAEVRRRLPRGPFESADLDADALASVGIDLDTVRRAADAAFGPGALDRAGQTGRSRLPIAPDAKLALAGAVRQAQQLRQRRISSAHLLLGSLEQRGTGALTVLSQAGADIAALRADTMSRVATPGG